MKVSDLLKEIEYSHIINEQDLEFSNISYNSKTAKEGDLFICLKGEHTDGHNFAKMAYENGVRVFVCERKLDCDAVQIIVNSTRNVIAKISAVLYENPSKKFNLIGLTGTNGKTTVTHLVQKILEDDNQKCALIGTLGYKLSSGGEYKEAKHTTPQAPELQHTFKTILDNGIKNVAMEVSSHALEQNRVGECEFNGAVLTNLTQDHLDYHITMNNYFDAKSILFKNLKEGAFAIINADDEYAQRFLDVVPEGVKIYTYGVKNNADIKAFDVNFDIHGASYKCKIFDKEYQINLELNGMFSVYNSLAALSVAVAMNLNIENAVKTLENTKCVAGRFEIVNKKPLIIVDYAHTPDGLKNVLLASKEIMSENAKLICLFGCGGDRDATKRPKMGQIADELADKIVITSDNPRSEDPELIISDIMTGIRTVDTKRVFVEPDRGNAIKLLTRISDENDVILVAGKGHEDYQILKDKTIHFDDREEVRKNFKILV